ncbi:GAP family protein [Streptomyces sp. NPDC093093]|uniref:GAP family protein n=1 Tax=Streptomyces sp. NPDC093093 TaxID=3366025 RepID=UPI0037F3578B
MVLDLMLIGLAIALDPLPIMAFVLVVTSARGVWKGLVFILAWLACLVTVIALVLLVTGGQPPAPRSPPGVAALAVKLAIGVGLLAYGLRRRRTMRRARADAAGRGGARTSSAGAGGRGTTLRGLDAADEPSSATTSVMDSPTLWGSAALAVLLQPWGLVAAGAVTVLDANTSHPATFVALFGFCLLASAGLLSAELYIVLAPEVAQVRLHRLRAWLMGHKEQAIVVGSLVLGLWLTAKNIYLLTG